MGFQTSPALQRMTELIDHWEQGNDQRAIFLRCYSMMTGNMLGALDEGRFRDGEWVGRLLDHFASYYFEGLARYEDPEQETTAAWQLAHKVAQEGKALPLQHLFLGVNAHISYDLVLATADMLGPQWPAMNEPLQQERYEDFCLINDIIGETTDSVQDQVLERIDPRMDILDKLLGPLDELFTSYLIRQWRKGVWNHALQLVGLAMPDEREELRRQVETISIQRAEFILHGPESGLRRSLFDL